MSEKVDSVVATNNQNNRNLGIELLRIVSMLMIVIIHLMGHNGIIKNTHPLSLNNNILYFLEILCFVSVNLYALTSGYVYIHSKHKWEKIIELWFQVFFYTFLVTGFFYIMPVKIFNITSKEMIKSILPVMSGEYWYFTSYFCLFLFIPFYNILIKNLTKKRYKQLICLCIMAFSVISLFAQSVGGDIFRVFYGFSFLWLSVMYFIGAYIRLYQEDFKKKNSYYFLMYLLCSILVWITEILFSIITLSTSGTINNNTFFIAYHSPFIVFGAIYLFIFFSKLKIKHGSNIILKLASVSFGVYIISEQKYLRTLFIVNKFNYLSDTSPFLTIMSLIFISIVIYLICFVIEWIRIKLFDFLHIKGFSKKIKDQIASIFNSL